jgi:chaperone modulatory protein CbpM
MKTLEDVLEMMEARIDRQKLETYIAREWVRPQRKKKSWYFEEIDIARLELVCHLTQDIEVNDEGMDVVLSLLDQLYGTRAHMRHLSHAITQQPSQVQEDIRTFLAQVIKAENNS